MSDWTSAATEDSVLTPETIMQAAEKLRRERPQPTVFYRWRGWTMEEEQRLWEEAKPYLHALCEELELI